MALLWMEGFESFGVTNGNAPVGFAAKWTAGQPDSNFTVRAGRIAGHSLRLSTNSTPQWTPRLGTPSTLVCGFGFYQDAFAAEVEILQFWDGLSQQGSLKIQTNGLWKYYRSSGNLLGTSSGSAVSASTWVYVELKVKFSTTVGTVDIWINGSNVLTLTSQNTSATGNTRATNAALVGSFGGSDHTQIDDLYILDDTGSVNNARLGPVVITMIQPASDAGTNQFTTSSGSNHYDRVNENPSNVNSTYLEDDTSGHRELFGMGTLQIGSVQGIQMNTVARTTDATQVSVKNSIHTSGGTDSDDSAQNVSTDYQTLYRIVETNPQTSALWRVSAINAAQFGFKVG